MKTTYTSVSGCDFHDEAQCRADEDMYHCAEALAKKVILLSSTEFETVRDALYELLKDKEIIPV